MAESADCKKFFSKKSQSMNPSVDFLCADFPVVMPTLTRTTRRYDYPDQAVLFDYDFGIPTVAMAGSERPARWAGASADMACERWAAEGCATWPLVPPLCEPSADPSPRAVPVRSDRARAAPALALFRSVEAVAAERAGAPRVATWTGPVRREVASEFWKVVAFVAGGRARTAGFLLCSDDAEIVTRDFGVLVARHASGERREWTLWQVAVRSIEAIGRIAFDAAVRAAEIDAEALAAAPRRVRSEGDFTFEKK